MRWGLGRQGSCEPGWGYSFDFDDDEGTVVGKRSVLRKPIDLSQDKVGEFSGIYFMMLFDQGAQPFGAKKLPFLISGFREAVRMEYQNVADIQGYAPLVVLNFLKNAQWETR